ncbi:PKS-ER domain-containing protein [Fusarium sp. LHS14.1]|nr:PKS-ER domain-containing protein [Fusarium sp. LHS14.1]
MGTKMEPEPLKEWIVLIPDVEGTLETRMKVRETHIKEMIKHIDSGLYQMGGGTLNGGQVNGSAIIARAKTEADVIEVLKTDIYARSGVWDLDKMQMIPSTAIIQKGKSLVVGQVELPPLKEHQVYVKVEYAAFNPTDRLALDINAFGDGAVLGCDFAGTVVEAHPSVTKIQDGDQIAGYVWGGEIKGLGAYSAYTIADERLSFKIPDNISAPQASSVPLAANTSWLALFSGDCLAINRDSSAKKTPLLVWGGSSAVGIFAIQIANLHGIEVVTTCSPQKFELAKNAGANHVFDYNDPEVASKIKTAVPDLQHVFDTIGNTTSSATAAQAIGKPGGVLCTVRPGKVNTENVPSTVKVTDVFVFTAFPTEHNYRGKAHWPVKMGDHKLSSEFHGQLESLLGNGSLKPIPIRILGQLSAFTVEEAMQANREGRISREKLVFEGFSEQE